MFVSKEGQTVPQVTFHISQGDQLIDVTTDDLFANKFPADAPPLKKLPIRIPSTIAKAKYNGK